MDDAPHDKKKVHDIYPDEPEQERKDSTNQNETLPQLSLANHARRRPSHVPRQVSSSYPAFKAKQECALKICVNGLAEEVAKSTGMGRIEMLKGKLTVYFRSQSKLSQQELSELQKATHFDKKELQQWYKGAFISTRLLNSSPNTFQDS